MSSQLFFYDQQIRRFLMQFIRIMSNYQVETGFDSTGTQALIRVPVIYGDASRQAAQILAKNSETNLSTVPVMAVNITELKYDRTRVQEPNFVSKMSIRQRAVDPVTGELQQVQGNTFSVERLMPVPYLLTLKLDIWTSSTEQKLQLLEQILAIFNPAIEVQNTDNYVDWTSLSYVELTDVTWSSRSVPIGTENPIDVATLSFQVPIWISAPAKVKKLGVIERIIASIYDTQEEMEAAILAGKLLNGQRQYVTPLNYSVLLLGGQLQVFLPNSTATANSNAGNVAQNWPAVINVFGSIRNGISEMHFSSEDGGPDIVGTIALNPLDPTVLFFTVDADTVPVNSLMPIDAIINPVKSLPGGKLSTPVSGQRYLLLDGIANTVAWGVNFVAAANDIIEFDGANWTVSFAAALASGNAYVTNINTGVQYKWNGSNWLKSYDGEYPAGRWHLVL